MTRRIAFRPRAVRDLENLDRIVQARIDAALVRYAATGHGDVKALKDRPGEFRLRVGKWRIFFSLEAPDLVRVLSIDNRGEAY
jgi:mRNA interferase RelE/StbE